MFERLRSSRLKFQKSLRKCAGWNATRLPTPALNLLTRLFIQDLRRSRIGKYILINIFVII